MCDHKDRGLEFTVRFAQSIQQFRGRSESRAPVGSSANRISGRFMMALAAEALCR